MPSPAATRSRNGEYCVGPPTNTIRSTSAGETPASSMVSRAAWIATSTRSFIAASNSARDTGISRYTSRPLSSLSLSSDSDRLILAMSLVDSSIFARSTDHDAILSSELPGSKFFAGSAKWSRSHGRTMRSRIARSKSLPPHTATPPWESRLTRPDMLSANATSSVPPPRSKTRNLLSSGRARMTLITAATGSCINATAPMFASVAAAIVASFCT